MNQGENVPTNTTPQNNNNSPMTKPSIQKADILKAITEYHELGDLMFMETINNMTFGYKADLRRKLNQEYEQREQ